MRRFTLSARWRQLSRPCSPNRPWRPAAATRSRAARRRQQATVRAALEVSSFDWSVLPARSSSTSRRSAAPTPRPATSTSTARCSTPAASRGASSSTSSHTRSTSSSSTTRSARRSTQRSAAATGATASPGLAHSAYGCERFASELAWAYWPSADNSMSPAATHGESGGDAGGAVPQRCSPRLLGVPTLATPIDTKAFAPATKPAHAKAKRKHACRARSARRSS